MKIPLDTFATIRADLPRMQEFRLQVIYNHSLTPSEWPLEREPEDWIAEYNAWVFLNSVVTNRKAK